MNNTEIDENEVIEESEVLILSEVDKYSLVAQKSEPLLKALWASDLTLQEVLLFDTYLGRIDSHKPNARAVAFDKKTIESIFGVSKINNSTLLTWVDHLMCCPIHISIQKANGDVEIDTINLFERTKVNGRIYNPEADEEDKIIDVNNMILECTPSARKYIFNIENIGYLRYRVCSVARLKSRYAYIKFQYIETNRFRKSWDEDVDTLKAMFKCENDVTYSEYKFFNAFILKKAQKEILENTECRYTYTPIKKGRNVIKIHFEVDDLPYEIIKKEEQEKLYKEEMEDMPFWTTALCFDNGVCEFTEKQLKVIQEVLVNVPSHKLLKGKSMWGAEASQYNYMCEKYAILNQVDEEKRRNGDKIDKRFEYLVQMIRKDTEE